MDRRLPDLCKGDGDRVRFRGGGRLEMGNEFLRGDGFLGSKEDRLQDMGEWRNLADIAGEGLLGDGLGEFGTLFG